MTQNRMTLAKEPPLNLFERMLSRVRTYAVAMVVAIGCERVRWWPSDMSAYEAIAIGAGWLIMGVSKQISSIESNRSYVAEWSRWNADIDVLTLWIRIQKKSTYINNLKGWAVWCIDCLVSISRKLLIITNIEVAAMGQRLRGFDVVWLK